MCISVQLGLSVWTSSQASLHLLNQYSYVGERHAAVRTHMCACVHGNVGLKRSEERKKRSGDGAE